MSEFKGTILNGVKPNQSGTFSNRTNFGTDDSELFVVEFNPDTTLSERAQIVGLIRALPELLDACKTVVDGYETDGMEQMMHRDEVFYKYCKAAAIKALSL